MARMRYSVQELRSRLRDIMDKLTSHDAIIERYGKPVAAVIPFEDYEAIVEDLEDIRAARRADEAWAEYDRNPGAFMTLEELRAKLEAEGVFDDNEATSIPSRARTTG